MRNEWISIQWLVVYLAILVLSGCGGADDGDAYTFETKEYTLSLSPTPDISINEGEVVNLSANAHISDSSGRITYNWTQISNGEQIDLSGAKTQEASFTAPQVEHDTVLIFQIRVSVEGAVQTTFNPGANQEWVYVTIIDKTVYPPVAKAGLDVNVISEHSLLLDGSSSSDRKSITSYFWQQVSGENVDINSSTQSQANIVAPLVSSTSEVIFELTVENEAGLTATDRITVNVLPPEPPIANISDDDQIVIEDTPVILNGSQSMDDLQIISFHWEQTSGPTMALIGADESVAKFTAPEVEADIPLEFTLTVTDSNNLQAEATAQVLIRPRNILPIAVISSQQDVNEKTYFSLDGSESTDNDGQVVSYLWTQKNGVQVEIVDATTMNAHFTSPRTSKEIDLEFELRVQDERGGIDQVSFAVQVAPINQLPTVEVSAPEEVAGGQLVKLEYSASDADGSIQAIIVEQTSGEGVLLIETSETSSTFFASKASLQQTLEFTFKAIDNENAIVSKTLNIKVLGSSSASVSEIYFPIHGSLYNNNLISVHGRTLEASAGVAANITVSTTVGSLTTISDAQGYWRVEDLPLPQQDVLQNITVSATHQSGLSSESQIQIVNQQVLMLNPTDIVQDCDNNVLYVLLENSEIVQMDCSGSKSSYKVIASTSTGTGVEMPKATLMKFSLIDDKKFLVLNGDGGLVGINLESGERSTLYPKSGESPITTAQLYVDRETGVAIVKDRSPANNDQTFLEINLASGESRFLPELKQGLSDNGIYSYVGLGVKNSLLYFINVQERFMSIDIEAGEIMDIADASAIGDSIYGFGSVKENEFFLFDLRNFNFLKIDGAQQKELSLPRVISASGGFRSIEMNKSTGEIYALLSGGSGTIIKISPESPVDVTRHSILYTTNPIKPSKLGDLGYQTYDSNNARVFQAYGDTIYTMSLGGPVEEFRSLSSVGVVPFDAWFERSLTYNSKSESLFVIATSEDDDSEMKIVEFDGVNAQSKQSPIAIGAGNKVVTVLSDIESGGVYLHREMLEQGLGNYSHTFDRSTYPIMESPSGVLAMEQRIPESDLGPMTFEEVIIAPDVNKIFAINQSGSLKSLNLETLEEQGAIDLSLQVDNYYSARLAWSKVESQLYLAIKGSLYIVDFENGLSAVTSNSRGRGLELLISEDIYVDASRKIILSSTLSRLSIIDPVSGDRVIIALE